MNTLRMGLILLLSAGLGAIVAGPAVAEYRETTVQNGGAIRGRVRLLGPPPTLAPLQVFKHKDVCGTSIPSERLVVGKKGGLQSVVAHIDGITAGKSLPTGPVALDNAKCLFVPHVQSATVGQMLEIHNSDPFLHDAHARLGARTLFNIAVPKGRTVHRPLAYAGLVHLNCNVRHTWMEAYIFVAEHPYHAVTAADGTFSIGDVPPGTYTLSVWHEMLGSEERQVTVEPGKTVTVDFEFASPDAAVP